jgi:hypothetical protein
VVQVIVGITLLFRPMHHLPGESDQPMEFLRGGGETTIVGARIQSAIGKNSFVLFIYNEIYHII